MTDIAIEKGDGGWDLALVDGDLVLLSDTDDPADQIAIVMQDIVYTLETWYGESPYEPGAGVPYLDFVFGQTRVGGVVAYLTQLVRNRPGVSAVENIEFILSSERELSISGNVTIAGKVVPLQLVVTPP